MSEKQIDGFTPVKEIYGRFVIVTELHKIDDRGNETYKYQAPTHWSPDGIVRLHKDNGPFGTKEFEYRYGSGGANSGFSMLEIADAVSTAQVAATERLFSLHPEMVAELEEKRDASEAPSAKF